MLEINRACGCFSPLLTGFGATGSIVLRLQALGCGAAWSLFCS